MSPVSAGHLRQAWYSRANGDPARPCPTLTTPHVFVRMARSRGHSLRVLPGRHLQRRLRSQGVYSVRSWLLLGATSCSLCPAGTHSSPAGRTTACTKCLYVGLAPSSDHVAETDLLVVLRAEPAMPRSLARISAKRVRRAPMPLESERPSAFRVRRAPTCTKSRLSTNLSHSMTDPHRLS